MVTGAREEMIVIARKVKTTGASQETPFSDEWSLISKGLYSASKVFAFLGLFDQSIHQNLSSRMRVAVKCKDWAAALLLLHQDPQNPNTNIAIFLPKTLLFNTPPSPPKLEQTW